MTSTGCMSSPSQKASKLRTHVCRATSTLAKSHIRSLSNHGLDGEVSRYLKLTLKSSCVFFCGYVKNAIVQDYLEGLEFTVDVCSDFEGRVLSVVPRERLVIRAGVSDKGTTRNHKRVMEFAINVAEQLQLIGAANIQCKWDGTTVKLIEVNPRFSGGMPLTIAAGADFPAWLVQLRGGRAVPPQIGRFEEDLTMMSFEESLFATEKELKITRNRTPRRRFARTNSSTAYVN